MTKNELRMKTISARAAKLNKELAKLGEEYLKLLDATQDELDVAVDELIACNLDSGAADVMTIDDWAIAGQIEHAREEEAADDN